MAKGKISIRDVHSKKLRGEKIVCITAYDCLFAGIFDSSVDIILVGDSLNMSFGGKPDTIDVTLDEMVYHSKAVCRGVKKSFVIGDMPFGSYSNVDDAIRNAVSYYKRSSVDAVKIEGDKSDVVKGLTSEGIAVFSHIGLTPQFVRAEGGYFVKGKDQVSRQHLIDTALALESAGAVGIVLEAVKSDVAGEITSLLGIPTIGIGSGVKCDGQILVWSDAFGLFDKFKPRFVRHFLNAKSMFLEGVKDYSESVRNGTFPSDHECY